MIRCDQQKWTETELKLLEVHGTECIIIFRLIWQPNTSSNNLSESSESRLERIILRMITDL